MKKVFILISNPNNDINNFSNRIEGVFSSIENANIKMNELINIKPYSKFNVFGPFSIDGELKNTLVVNNVLSNPILKIPELKKDIPEIKNPDLNISIFPKKFENF